MTLAPPVRGAKHNPSAAKALADRYIARDGRPPKIERAPTRRVSKAGFDRQYLLSLISDVEGDLRIKKYARAKATLKILRQALWNPPKRV